jgi:hypothetical protein
VNEIHAAENISELDSACFNEGPLQNGFGNLEPNKIVVRVRRIPAFGDLYNVKAEFGANVGLWILCKRYGRPYFAFNLGIPAPLRPILCSGCRDQ